MTHSGLVGEVVRGFLRRFPNTPSRTVAAALYRENRPLFRNVEAARGAVRYYRGSTGGQKRNSLSTNEFIGDGRRVREMPKSLAPPYEDHALEAGAHIVMQDVHLPFHDRRAVEAAVQFAAANGIRRMLLNGDILDCHALSRFQKDPRTRDIKQEVLTFRQFIGYVRNKVPRAKIVYKEGNHEERWWKYLWERAPELLGVEEVRIENVLGFGAAGITWVDNRRRITAGRLTIVHGHEFWGNTSQAVNPARGLFLKAGASAYCGHFHKASSHSEPDINDKMISCWSGGCLADLHPQYARINKWAHGFSVLVLSKSGGFELENKKIINGKVYPA